LAPLSQDLITFTFFLISLLIFLCKEVPPFSMTPSLHREASSYSGDRLLEFPLEPLPVLLQLTNYPRWDTLLLQPPPPPTQPPNPKHPSPKQPPLSTLRPSPNFFPPPLGFFQVFFLSCPGFKVPPIPPMVYAVFGLPPLSRSYTYVIFFYNLYLFFLQTCLK